MLELSRDSRSLPKHQALLGGQTAGVDHGNDPIWPTVKVFCTATLQDTMDFYSSLLFYFKKRCI